MRAGFDRIDRAGLSRGGVEVVVLDGADHALDVDDPATSRLLADLLERPQTFVASTAG